MDKEMAIVLLGALEREAANVKRLLESGLEEGSKELDRELHQLESTLEGLLEAGLLRE